MSENPTPLERIQVSADGHFLVTASGKPFFWLGDTAWELFHRLTKEEAEVYLENRRERGFNLIQAVLLGELDGLHTPNRYGRLPLAGDDPTRPNDYYFRDVDTIIRMAAAKGIYIGLLPTWADKVIPAQWGVGPNIFTVDNARVYGRWLGERYREDTNIVWILGGDRYADGYEPLWAAMAGGIAEGLGRKPLCSYHPPGGLPGGTAGAFHNTEWLDVNMWQSGHSQTDAPNWEMISTDYRRRPVKPVLDAEPCYEDHPIDPWSRRWQPAFGRFTDYDVRKQAYRAVLAGACGHTYGHHSIWQFYAPPREPVNFPMFAWDEAIHRPGAAQLQHLKALVLSRPYLSRLPDQGLLLSDPGQAGGHIRAARDAEGRYAMLYIPQANRTVELNLQLLAAPVRAWWYDPRTGQAWPLGEVSARSQAFTTPLAGPDWVLVLDSVAANFGAPGQITG